MQEDDEIIFRERDARNAATRWLSTPEGLQKMKEQIKKRKLHLDIKRKDIKDDVRCCCPSCGGWVARVAHGGLLGDS